MPFDSSLQNISLVVVAHLRVNHVFFKISQDSQKKLCEIYTENLKLYLETMIPIMQEWCQFVQSSCTNYNVSTADSNRIQTDVRHWIRAILAAIRKPTHDGFLTLISTAATTRTTILAVNPKILTEFFEHRKVSEAIIKAFFKTHGEAFLQKVAEVASTDAMDTSSMDDAVFLTW
jgi:hypothetical protein